MASSATEFIIGLQKPESIELTPNSNLLEMVLITEVIKKITLIGSYVGDYPCLSAIIFDDGTIDLRVRDMPVTLIESNDETNSLVESLDLPGSPFADEIILQQTCFSASDQPHLYWRRITYINIRLGSTFIEIGKLREPSESIQGKFKILPKEVVSGRCMISGVGMHNADLICLQIIHISQRRITSSNTGIEMGEHQYAYGKSSVGLVNLQSQSLQGVEATNFVAYECSDPDAMDIFKNLSNFMFNWYGSRSSIHRMFPDLYSLIDQSITENDRGVIFATLRIARHLRWRIQNESKNQHDFDRDPFVRLKLFKVVESLANTLERCQRIIVNKPSLDCFSIAYLSGEMKDKVIAALVLITQISLSYMLFMSILQDNEGGVTFFQWNERAVVTPILAIFSGMLVYKQISNAFATFQAYPEMKYSLMGIFEIMGNAILGVIVLIIQIFIIARTADRIEYVLNSIAAIFILELDDSIVFLDDDAITDLNRQLLMKDFRERINEIDESFFKFMDWRTARNSHQIITEDCDLKPLPPIEFTLSNKSLTNSSELEPVKIVFAEQRGFHGASDGWVEIASSDTIVTSKLNEKSNATVSFAWCDQGFGNRKGRLRVRLVDADTNSDVASTPEYGIAPHEYEEVKESFGFNHGLVRNSTTGYKFVVEVIVGGGGGHALNVKNFNFICTSGLVPSVEGFDDSSKDATDIV